MRLKTNSLLLVFLMAVLLAAVQRGAVADRAGSKGKTAAANPAVKLVPLVPKVDFGPKPLTGSLEHSEVLPPVKKELQTGAVFNAAVLPKVPLNEDWFWIPAWRAGTWRSQSDTLTYYKNFKTGEEHKGKFPRPFVSVVYKGFQKDRTGQIWEYRAAPYVQMAGGSGFTEVQIIKENKPVYVSDRKITMYLRGTSVRVDPRSKRIMATEQWESLQTFQPAGNNRVTCAGSTKFFDPQGRPSYIQKNTATFTRVAPFKPINSVQGKDLRTSFCKFLVQHKLDRLVPQ